MWKQVLPLFIVLFMAQGTADAKSLSGPTCPAAWTFDGQRLKLRWAEVWAGWESLAPIEGRTRDGKDWQEPEGRREADEVFWDMGNFRKPAFLYCVYGSPRPRFEAPSLIVSVPDNSKTCHAAYLDTPKTTYITDISCSPGKAPVPPISMVERITPLTALDALMLRKSQAELKALTATRSAVWTDGSDENSATVVFPDNGARYRVVFSSASGLAREIALIGPVFDQRYDFVVAIQRRFGPYNLNPWKGEDNVWIDWDDGYRKGKPRVPEQMRLLDLNDPQTQFRNKKN